MITSSLVHIVHDSCSPQVHSSHVQMLGHVMQEVSLMVAWGIGAPLIDDIISSFFITLHMFMSRAERAVVSL